MCKGRWQRVRQSYYAIMNRIKAIVEEKRHYISLLLISKHFGGQISFTPRGTPLFLLNTVEKDTP